MIDQYIGATDWLASDHRCAASDTLLSELTGVDVMAGQEKTHPETVADFRSCRMMLAAIPELQSCLPRAAHISPIWNDFVNFWADYCIIHDLEDPDWNNELRDDRKATRLKDMIGYAIANFTSENGRKNNED